MLKSSAPNVELLDFIYRFENGPCAQTLGIISEFAFYHGGTCRGAIPSKSNRQFFFEN